MGSADPVLILQVSDIVAEATAMKSIFLGTTDGLPIDYAAGQFLTLLFSFHGRELRRSYSFATTPGVDPIPAICVKRVPNGEISRHLLDRLRVGDLLTTLPPAGRFTLDDPGAAPVVFIAAGSGLVPEYALLKQALAQYPGARVLLATQQHDAASSPFRGAMRKLVADFGEHRFGWTEMLTVRDGRIHRSWLEDWVLRAGVLGDIAAARFYLCGPAGFMRMVQFTLRTMGVPDARIRREHFTVDQIPPAPPLFDATPKKVTVHDLPGDDTPRTQAGWTVAWPDSILTAALRQGVSLPYSCRAGRCSSCVARCLKGRVRMTNNEVLTDRDLRAGLILTCVGYAETDVELSYAISSASNAIGSSEPDRGIS